MDQSLGKRIVAGRKKAGLTQDQLAERLGVTAQAVSKWENDQSCPDITMLPKLAEIFGTTTDALLGMAPEAEAVQAEVVREEEEPEGIHWDNGSFEVNLNSGRKSSIGMAVWVLLAGGLLLASTVLHWEVSLWDILWPSGLMVFGLFGLYPRFSVLRLGCALFGGYYLAGNFFPLHLNKSILLPLLLVLFGLNLLVDALRKPKFRSVIHKGKNGVEKNTFRYDGERFVTATSFGESHRRVELARLSGGKASVSFGELELDITGCEEFAPDCTLDLSCSFGELELLVPRTCRVEHTASSSFASVEFKGHPDADAKDRIFLNCSANFGEIDIRYI